MSSYMMTSSFFLTKVNNVEKEDYYRLISISKYLNVLGSGQMWYGECKNIKIFGLRCLARKHLFDKSKFFSRSFDECITGISDAIAQIRM